jgi:hypothetical protein
VGTAWDLQASVALWEACWKQQKQGWKQQEQRKQAQQRQLSVLGEAAAVDLAS